MEGGKPCWKFLFCGQYGWESSRRAQLLLPTGQDYGPAQSLMATGALGEAGGFSSLEDSVIP